MYKKYYSFDRCLIILVACLGLCFQLKFLEANLTDYFKPCPNKSEENCFDNIDFIYMINLDERPEKFERCRRLLEPYGIRPYRFSAINGWELSLEDINNVGTRFTPGMKGGLKGTSYLTSDLSPSHSTIDTYGQTYFTYQTSRGCIGIALSHLSVLQDAYDSGYETIWVMEDDIEIRKDPRKIPELIRELDKNLKGKEWDVLFTDVDTRLNKGKDIGKLVPCYSAAKRMNFNPKKHNLYHERKTFGKFMKIGARYGAYSMIMRRSGIKKILNFIKARNLFLPYDMEIPLPPGIKLFAIKDPVVSHMTGAISDNGKAPWMKRD